jgi:hypothetical protein
VLKGAKNLLVKNKPVILFECGKGASDYYGTDPLELFDFLNDIIGVRIFTLDSYIKDRRALSREGFEGCYEKNLEYYFVGAV